MAIKDRLKTFIEHLGIDVKSFEISAGLSNGFVNNAGNSIREGSLNKISGEYPELNTVWLITGSGEMLNNARAKEKLLVYGKKIPASKPVIEAVPLWNVHDPHDFEMKGERFQDMGDGTLRFRVPVIPHKAFAGGYLRGFSDPEYYEDLKTTYIEVNKEYRGHYLAFEVKGESMTTTEEGLLKRNILDGWTVVGREVPRHHWGSKLHIGTNDAWVIVHKEDGIMIKNIIKHDIDSGYITIHSLNPDKKVFPDRELFLDDVEQIFNIVRRLPPD